MEGNRKGLISFEMIYWIARVMFLIIVIVSIIFLVRMYIKGHTDTESVEMTMMINHFLYSPDSIMYYDEIAGRPMPGIIDIDKLNELTLDRAFYFGEKNTMAAAKIELYDIKNSLVKEAMYNKIYYERWIPLAGKSGAGAVAEKDFETLVVYKSGKTFNNGIMRIKVLIPKS